SIATSFSFTAAPTTAIYTLSLHDALPILIAGVLPQFHKGAGVLLDVSGHILEVQYARADQDLAGHKAAQFRNDRRAELFCFQFVRACLAGDKPAQASAGLPPAPPPFGLEVAQVVVFVLF